MLPKREIHRALRALELGQLDFEIVEEVNRYRITLLYRGSAIAFGRGRSWQAAFAQALATAVAALGGEP